MSMLSLEFHQMYIQSARNTKTYRVLLSGPSCSVFFLRSEREPQMESFLSTVLGELMTRSINFIINKCSNPPVLAMEDSLQRALLRAQAIVDEAMGRHITNQAMLQLLGMLIDAMHQGYYTLDTFRYQPQYAEDSKDQAVSHFMFLSKVNFAKGPYFSSSRAQIWEPLREALDRLTSVIVDVDELVVFLMSYPHLYRRPYSMHILLSNCMFGRRMEVELVINFLLHKQPHGSEELEFLPIVGPARVGKSTLVAHVCKDERVRDHFSEVLFLHDRDFTDDKLAFREECSIKHQNSVSKSNKDERLLLVVEFAGDLSEDAWNRLFYASRRCVPRNSKIIVMSRSDKVVQLGTTQALTLKNLSVKVVKSSTCRTSTAEFVVSIRGTRQGYAPTPWFFVNRVIPPGCRLRRRGRGLNS
jgi:hypothetical protein